MKTMRIKSILVGLLLVVFLSACAVTNESSEEVDIIPDEEDFMVEEVGSDYTEWVQPLVDKSIAESYARVAWTYDEENDLSVEVVIEQYEPEIEESVIASIDDLYSSVADEYSIMEKGHWDRKSVAIYPESNVFEDGATIRLYTYNNGSKFYVITIEQYSIKLGQEAVQMNILCDDVVCYIIGILNE